MHNTILGTTSPVTRRRATTTRRQAGRQALRLTVLTVLLGAPAVASARPTVTTQVQTRRTPARSLTLNLARNAVVVSNVSGRRVQARGLAARDWVPGMKVWILEAPGGLPICEAIVRFRHGQQVSLLLPKDAPTVPIGAVVDPRWVAEARLYGWQSHRPQHSKNPGKSGFQHPGTLHTVTQHTGTQPASEAGTRPWQVWHTRPAGLSWGKSLWLEIVATPAIASPHVRWRVGRQGPFRDATMKAAADGRWTVTLQPGETAPKVRVLQYYVGADVTLNGKTSAQVIVAHAAQPHEIPISSAPRRRVRSPVDHTPPSRWTHRRALILSARIDKRYRSPVVLYRPRGGGTFDVAPMRRVSAEVWRAVVPAGRVVVPGIAYYLAATDEHGVTRPIFRGPRRPMRVRVTRGKILSTKERRNRLAVTWTRADNGQPGDTWQRLDIGMERLFFGFLVGRLGASATWGEGLQLQRDSDSVGAGDILPGSQESAILTSLPLNLYGGHAGLELRAGDYLRGSGDLLMAIHNGGAGIGYRLIGHIGDEAGANLFASWASLSDVDTGRSLLERLRLGLSTPLTTKVRLAGVVIHESVLQDSSKALRFQVELTYTLAQRVFLTGRIGFSGRDADNPGSTGGAGVAMTF